MLLGTGKKFIKQFFMGTQFRSENKKRKEKMEKAVHYCESMYYIPTECIISKILTDYIWSKSLKQNITACKYAFKHLFVLLSYIFSM